LSEEIVYAVASHLKLCFYLAGPYDIRQKDSMAKMCEFESGYENVKGR